VGALGSKAMGKRMLSPAKTETLPPPTPTPQPALIVNEGAYATWDGGPGEIRTDPVYNWAGTPRVVYLPLLLKHVQSP